MREWVARLNAISTQAENVFATNQYRGQGPVTALERRALLEGQPVAVPDDLRRSYPRLKKVACPPRQPGLFNSVP